MSKRLTTKEELFLTALFEHHGNASEAARQTLDCQPGTAGASGFDMLKRVREKSGGLLPGVPPLADLGAVLQEGMVATRLSAGKLLAQIL